MRLTLPGIYHQAARPSRRFGGLARGDVPVLIGYALRGPALEPIRIESLRQFQAVFGAPLPSTHLYDAVRGFFESGGLTAYVVRVVGANAKPASAWLTDEPPVAGENPPTGVWYASAHRPRAALMPGNMQADIQPWLDKLARRYAHSIPDPGDWANQLTLRVTRRTQVRGGAITFTDRIHRLQPDSLSGIHTGSLLALFEGSAPIDITGAYITRVVQVHTPERELTLDKDLSDFLPGLVDDLSFQVISFDFEILNAGQRAELFTDIHLDANHPRSLELQLNRRSLYLALAFANDGLWTDSSNWPREGDYALGGGLDDLSNITRVDWQAAIRSQSDIDEIALLATPDLVMQGTKRRTDLGISVPTDSCHLPEARPIGRISGQVTDEESGEPVAGAQVLAAGHGILVETDDDGRFVIAGVTPSLVELRVVAEHFEPLEQFVQPSSPQAPADTIDITLHKLSDIVALPEEDIISLQREMGTGGIAGPWRIAVLDPPAPDLSPEALLAWRAQFVGDQRLFAIAPWLQLAQDGSEALVDQPPSGHVCGVFAQGEQAQGIHRGPANLALRHVKQLSTPLDDQALLQFHEAALNALRVLPGQGIRLMGARTLSAQLDWRQVSVRRLFDAIEKTLQAQLSWSVFEPNNITTRQIMTYAVTQFLEGLRKRGMFAGSSAAQSYSVKSDVDNNIPATVQRGEMIMEIGVAPTLPYEFILFSLNAQADAIEVTEQP